MGWAGILGAGLQGGMKGYEQGRAWQREDEKDAQNKALYDINLQNAKNTAAEYQYNNTRDQDWRASQAYLSLDDTGKKQIEERASMFGVADKISRKEANVLMNDSGVKNIFTSNRIRQFDNAIASATPEEKVILQGQREEFLINNAPGILQQEQTKAKNALDKDKFDLEKRKVDIEENYKKNQIEQQKKNGTSSHWTPIGESDDGSITLIDSKSGRTKIIPGVNVRGATTKKLDSLYKERDRLEDNRIKYAELNDEKKIGEYDTRIANINSQIDGIVNKNAGPVEKPQGITQQDIANVRAGKGKIVKSTTDGREIYIPNSAESMTFNTNMGSKEKKRKITTSEDRLLYGVKK